MRRTLAGIKESAKDGDRRGRHLLGSSELRWRGDT
jgi:hypothetical protein